MATAAARPPGIGSNERLGATLVLSLLLPWLFESKVVAMTVLGLAMACWIAVLAIAEAALRISRGTKTTFSYWGMVAAHLGLAVTIVGIALARTIALSVMCA